MKKVKIVFWLIVLIIIAIIIYQNIDFLKYKHELSFVKYKSSQFSNAVLLSATFLFGLMVSYIVSLAERFKLRKTIKKLDAEIASHIKELSEFRAGTHEQDAPIDKHTETLE
jgi:uncharacterized integral membrane protein